METREIVNINCKDVEAGVLAMYKKEIERGVAIFKICPTNSWRGNVWIDDDKYCDQAGKCINKMCKYNIEKK